MKRLGLFLLAVLMVGGIGCSSGGGDEDYNFGGDWMFTRTLTASQGTWTFNSGYKVSITQNGTSVLTSLGETNQTGICNPKTGSISWSFDYVGDTTGTSYHSTYEGHMIDNDTMTGTGRTTSQATGNWAEYTWTAERL